MNNLVYPHRLEMGGPQTNTIELAAALSDMHGFDDTFLVQPEPKIRLVEEKGLRFLPAPIVGFHPSTTRNVALRDIAADHNRSTSSANGRLKGLFGEGMVNASFGSHPVF